MFTNYTSHGCRWPKHLNSQLMFWKFKFNLGIPKLFRHGSEGKIHLWKVLAFPKWKFMIKALIGISEVLVIQIHPTYILQTIINSTVIFIRPWFGFPYFCFGFFSDLLWGKIGAWFLIQKFASASLETPKPKWF